MRVIVNFNFNNKNHSLPIALPARPTINDNLSVEFILEAFPELEKRFTKKEIEDIYYDSPELVTVCWWKVDKEGIYMVVYLE